MTQVVKPRALQFGAVHNRAPDVCLEHVRIDEPVAVSREYESGIRVAYLEVGEESHDAFGCRDAAQRFASLRRPEIPLPFVNAILAEALRNCALDADLVVKPANSREPQPQHLAPAHSTKGAQVGNRVTNAPDLLRGVNQRPRLLRCWWDNLAGLKRSE